MTATVESLQHILSLLADDSHEYLRTTPPEKQRAAKLTLIRRLCAQCGIGTIHEVTPKTARTLAKLYEAYVDSLMAQVNSGTCKSSILTEAGLLLRSHGINAQSIAEGQQARNKAPTGLKLVPSQGLPFTAAGKRVVKES